MKIVQVKVADLIFAEYNPRQLSEKQGRDLMDSIKRFGFVDPIIVNSNEERKNIIIGGHQRARMAQILDIEKIPVHYVDLTPEKEKELNIRLNKNTGEWDFDQLANYFDTEELTDWGFSEEELQVFDSPKGEPGEENESLYTDKIESPIYEPTGGCPTIDQMMDTTKTEQLVEKISKANLPKDVKAFLLASAHRHTVFTYDQIGNFYAHQEKEIQELMEDSALVVIDIKKAIEQGFVKTTSALFDVSEGEDEG